MELLEKIAKRDKTQAHYIWWCCEQMRQAKTRQDVYRLMTIWTNHVDKSHDWLIKECIPMELR